MPPRFSRLMIPALFFLFPPAASSSVWVVLPDGSGDAPTIGAAIDSIESEGIIELEDGLFTGPGNRDLNSQEKTIFIRSVSGDPASCVIDCEGSAAEPHCFLAFFGGG